MSNVTKHCILVVFIVSLFTMFMIKYYTGRVIERQAEFNQVAISK